MVPKLGRSEPYNSRLQIKKHATCGCELTNIGVVVLYQPVLAQYNFPQYQSQHPMSKFFSQFPSQYPICGLKPNPIPILPNVFPIIVNYEISLNFRFRPLTISSTIAPKVLKSLFKWLNNRNSNISSLREVRRLLMTKPAVLKILSTAVVVGVAKKTFRNFSSA